MAAAITSSPFRLPTLRRQLELREIETWRDCAADQAPCAEALRALPAARMHKGLRTLPVQPIGAETKVLAPAVLMQPEQQRRAAISVPELGGIDAMPARDLARL